ncbi:hypothetical protein SDRG_01118 [Saprolegnia diclina VS20]|uniref:START domain-containing protein n=1 Tax=Saprolegnia diclina (strain VS20) TaxID=1156394 RepID=T0R473_SAPDV|nr:hypothetical protein SDRG_01118 [Saprolegnia diclina VS20]EQC41140.1 hypothetical protein SDRG_01118 [Saprolegnia diclina VS20]|eukprot:XP_008604854.1 hypothetical protein SDRG_01118 [Saprolegnia diclina VS20]
MDRCAAEVVNMLDLATCDYSTQWSAEESEMLDLLCADSPKPHDDRKTILQRHRLKKREEREELKRAAVELEAKLLQLQQAKVNPLLPPTKWKQLASDEARREGAAKSENKQLKELVQAHMVTAQALANLLEKTRERTGATNALGNPTEKWKQLILVQDPSLRTAAIHHMLDREHAKLFSAFVEASLVDATGDIQKHIAKYGHHDAMEFHSIGCRHVDQPLPGVLLASLDVLRGSVPIAQLNRRCKELVTIDADTTYVIGTFDHPLGEFQRRILCKVYGYEGVPRHERCVVVCRSIHEDELLPYDPSTPYAVEVAWLTLEANKTGGTDVKYFQKFRPSTWSAATPVSSHWLSQVDEHSKNMRHAARRYIDQVASSTA